ncbi:hypothetical protein VP1G_03431 [Cytospora mali]|uniref:Rhodopsin domain-containing protein n=1 Tax=Cytospora mali TaxID=578113 RepID=A0A194UWN5_CYTMA|nr:hypothetical protein VP1G_03431 [Valsa mali var. pyri (nom. inval.)]
MPLRNKIWITLMISLGGVNLCVMCYRLYAAIHPSADASSDNVTQRIFSFFEMWISVIVACMPIVVPIFVNYILPLATSNHSRLFGTKSSTNDSMKMGKLRAAIDEPAVNTFHISDPASRKKRAKYSMLDDSALAINTFDRDEAGADSGEVHLTSPRATVHVQTDCAPAQDESPRRGAGIYVQQGFHAQWNNV